MEKKYMSVAAAAAYSGLSKHYLYRCTSKKSFQFLKVGSRCLIDIEKFDKWLQKHSTDSGEGK